MIRTSAPWLVALSVLITDRVSKLWIIHAMPHGTRRPVIPGFTLTHVHNRGIAFSLFSDGGPLTQLVLALVVVITIAVIAWLLVRNVHGSAAQSLALGAILGGALGNLLDRLMHGWVIDFVEVWIRVGDTRYSWPDFNVADAAITVGAVVLVASEILRSRGGKEEGARSASSPD